jgi:hypothetical protein
MSTYPDSLWQCPKCKHVTFPQDMPMSSATCDGCNTSEEAVYLLRLETACECKGFCEYVRICLDHDTCEMHYVDALNNTNHHYNYGMQKLKRILLALL